jgi:hypothetical protein
MKKKCWHNMIEKNKKENVILKLMVKMLRKTKWFRIEGDDDVHENAKIIIIHVWMITMLAILIYMM